MHTPLKRTLVAAATSGLQFTALTATAGAWGDRDSWTR